MLIRQLFPSSFLVLKPFNFASRCYSSTLTRKYTRDHEWIQVDSKGLGTIGITDYAQKALGDVVYVEFPSEGTLLNQKDVLGAVESVKAASDIYAPVTGQVKQVNKQLEKEPSLINSSPFDQGWIAKIQLKEQDQLSDLLDEQSYEKYTKSL